MRVVALVAVALLALPATASAFEDYVGTRALGMGGTGRALATGGAGPLLNPSGMTLAKLYHVEAGYGYSSRLDDHFLHASVVDSTSDLLLAGGLYYTYHLNQPAGLPSGHGHEVGSAAAVPLGQYVSVGSTIKYFRLEGGQAPNGHAGGVTFDAGVTVRPMSELSFGFVGTNLHDLHNSEAPQGIAYGGAFLPIPTLLLAVDGVTPFTFDDHTGRKFTSLMGGADLLLAETFDLRAGGGYDGTTGNFYASGGLSVLGEIGAIDVSLRQDLTRHELAPGLLADRVTVFAVSLRLFVPTVQTPP